MASHVTNADRRRCAAGTHRRRQLRRSWFARTVAAGGAALSLGVAYDLSSPTADALSILLPGPTVNGVGNTTRINIFEGNIFNPQLGIDGGNTSSNTTSGNVVIGQGNNIINQLLSAQLDFTGGTGNGNVTQINILSYNIFNPQFSLIGPNISNNTSVNNVAMNNGNNSATGLSTGGGLLPWMGGAAGNGNTTQFSFFSGNIFNPQVSLFGGANLSTNTTMTNVAIGNGNFSQTTLSLGGWFATFLGGGNGNTFQYAFFVSNIYNPQFTFGGGNISHNTAVTNSAEGNGNNSSTDVTGGGLGTAVGGTIGNGNTTQGSFGSGNISNEQVNVGPGPTSPIYSTTLLDDAGAAPSQPSTTDDTQTDSVAMSQRTSSTTETRDVSDNRDDDEPQNSVGDNDTTRTTATTDTGNDAATTGGVNAGTDAGSGTDAGNDSGDSTGGDGGGTGD